jgi:hypothetical protein
MQKSRQIRHTEQTALCAFVRGIWVKFVVKLEPKNVNTEWMALLSSSGKEPVQSLAEARAAQILAEMLGMVCHPECFLSPPRDKTVNFSADFAKHVGHCHSFLQVSRLCLFRGLFVPMSRHFAQSRHRYSPSSRTQNKTQPHKTI